MRELSTESQALIVRASPRKFEHTGIREFNASRAMAASLHVAIEARLTGCRPGFFDVRQRIY